MTIRTVAPLRGLAWIAQGIDLLRRSPLNWLATAITLWAVYQIGFGLAAASSGLSALILILLTPVFVGGIMMGCTEFEHGRAINLVHMLAGFRAHGPRLVALGGFYLLGQVALFWMMRWVGGDSLEVLLEGRIGELSDLQLAEALPQLMRALMAGFALSVPVLMAMVFAAPLVTLGKYAPLPAMVASLQACLRNLPAMLVYSAALLCMLVVVVIPFGKIDPFSNPAPWIVAPVALPSLYIAYQELFGASQPHAMPE